MNSKDNTAVELRLFIGKLRYYEEGLVEMVRENLMKIGLTEYRGYYSHYFVGKHLNIYLTKKNNKEVYCSYANYEDIVEIPRNPYYDGKPLLNAKNIDNYESFLNRKNVYYTGIVDKWVRVIKFSERDLFVI